MVAKEEQPAYTDKDALGGIDGVRSVERAHERKTTGPESAGPPRDLIDRETLKKHIAGRSDAEPWQSSRRRRRRRRYHPSSDGLLLPYA